MIKTKKGQNQNYSSIEIKNAEIDFNFEIKDAVFGSSSKINNVKIRSNIRIKTDKTRIDFTIGHAEIRIKKNRTRIDIESKNLKSELTLKLRR